MTVTLKRPEPDFWQRLDDARQHLLADDHEQGKSRARTILTELYETLDGIEPEFRDTRFQALGGFCDTYGLAPETRNGPQMEEGSLLTAWDVELPGISLVTCSMNRTDNLLLALPSWLAADGIDQIVIVDWCSDIPVQETLRAHDISSTRIKVVRVENEPRWILSYAFNIGFRLARHKNILKVDSDIIVHPDFLRSNILQPRSYIAGNWRDVGDDQAFVNGFFYAARKDLLKVNGFNEFITTYGWDDDDLYDRLNASGLERRNVAQGMIFHVDHDDEERVSGLGKGTTDNWQAFTSRPEFKIQSNKILAELAPDWSQEQNMLAFEWHQNASGDMVLRRAEATPYPVHDGLCAQLEMLTTYKLVSWVVGPQVFSVSPEVLRQIIVTNGFDAISRRKFLRQAEAAKLVAPAVATSARKRFYIDAQHGLGNRMRAIGSGAAIAKNTDRELVIVWEPDDHCECRMSDLFDYSGEVIEKNMLADAREQNFSIYNYMEIEEGAHKDAPLDPDQTGDIYARSAYPLKSPHTSWREENTFLQSLIPTQGVKDLLAQVPGPNDLSVHVRMVGGQSAEHLSYEASENWTEEGHEQINHWRSKSHFSNFMARIDALTTKGECKNFFLAADNPETYQEFSRAYGDRVQFLSREVYDRSSEQLLYALADAILLSRTPRLLGSNWSSFTELAMRLSPHKIKLEMSGTDF